MTQYGVWIEPISNHAGRHAGFIPHFQVETSGFSASFESQADALKQAAICNQDRNGFKYEARLIPADYRYPIQEESTMIGYDEQSCTPYYLTLLTRHLAR